MVQPAQIASLAMQTVRRFMRSADDTISIRHAPIPDGLEHAAGLPGLRARLVQLAAAAWEDLTDPNGALRCEHEAYLKLWAMSRPVLRAYGMIMVDEAQDTDPLLAQVIAGQGHAQIIVVGDENQSIYGWRGATDFLTRFPAERSVSLTRSFRFGPAIADEANVWLAHLRAALRVEGDPSKRSAVRSIDAPDAILCRTNAGALPAVIAQIEQRRRVALVGGASDLERFVGAAQDVQHGRPTTHPDLLAFGSWSEVKAYAQTEEGADLAVWVRLIERHTCDGLLSAIRTTVDEARAEVVVSTAHKAKGRQWPAVRIWNDFPEPGSTR